jgi:hypothetical protein
MSAAHQGHYHFLVVMPNAFGFAERAQLSRLAVGSRMVISAGEV